MNLIDFGHQVSKVIDEKDLSGRQKESIILMQSKELDSNDISDVISMSISEILMEMDELDYKTFAKVTLYILNMQKRIDDLTDEKDRSIIQKITTPYSRNQSLNRPRCFNNGRPCMRCNRLANSFNQKGVKITLPKQHPYSRCPLYCNICPNKLFCENPEKHLDYSCNICESTYCNHPTEYCPSKDSPIEKK